MDYQHFDGLRLTANTPEEIVVALRASAFDPGDSMAEYVKTLAKTSTLFNGFKHRSTSAAVLGEDLMLSGLVKRIP